MFKILRRDDGTRANYIAERILELSSVFGVRRFLVFRPPSTTKCIPTSLRPECVPALDKYVSAIFEFHRCDRPDVNTFSTRARQYNRRIRIERPNASLWLHLKTPFGQPKRIKYGTRENSNRCL